jgi:CheY-like chemotaxis protein
VTGSRSVLIVEDEPLIAMMLEDFLESLGHSIAGTCESVAEAMAKVEQGGFDVAIIDVHLKGEKVWPVADRLAARGLPYVLATGGHIDPPPPAHAAAPILAKPFTIEAVEPALAKACGE